ncbi:MAG TPA: hypothetical protein VGM20_10220 [Gemmatimonadales bacterium]
MPERRDRTGGDTVFGDSMFDEEDRLRRAEEPKGDDEFLAADDEYQDVTAAGGLDETLRRRQAVAQLLREVGGC